MGTKYISIQTFKIVTAVETPISCLVIGNVWKSKVLKKIVSISELHCKTEKYTQTYKGDELFVKSLWLMHFV